MAPDFCTAPLIRCLHGKAKHTRAGRSRRELCTRVLTATKSRDSIEFSILRFESRYSFFIIRYDVERDLVIINHVPLNVGLDYV